MTTGGDRHAFITGPNGMGMRDLGSYIYVSAINDAGQLVGGSSTDVEAHAFVLAESFISPAAAMPVVSSAALKRLGNELIESEISL